MKHSEIFFQWQKRLEPEGLKQAKMKDRTGIMKYIRWVQNIFHFSLKNFSRRILHPLKEEIGYFRSLFYSINVTNLWSPTDQCRRTDQCVPESRLFISSRFPTRISHSEAAPGEKRCAESYLRARILPCASIISHSRQITRCSTVTCDRASGLNILPGSVTRALRNVMPPVEANTELANFIFR